MTFLEEPRPVGTVLITGAASGIGNSTAKLFASKNWRCILVDRDQERLQSLKTELDSQHSEFHQSYVLDLTEPQSIETLGENIPDLDALVNNAGVSHSGASALVSVEEQMPAKLLALNLAAPSCMVRACSSRLRPGARVVNVSSGAGLRAIPFRGLYSPSKAGLLAQTQALAKAKPEWTVTSLAPGFVRTELVQKLIEDGTLRISDALSKIPMGRLAESWEIANAVYFLAAQAPASMSGQNLSVCGGSSVYGGSQKLAKAAYHIMLPVAPVNLTVLSPLMPSWLVARQPSRSQMAFKKIDVYNGFVDGSACLAPVGQVMKAVQKAASNFFQIVNKGPTSLTLILPLRNVPWEHAGDLAAARMLVSTLAAEWGVKGLRINAIEAEDKVLSQDIWSILDFLSSAGAQYVTGQTLRLQEGNLKA